MRRILLEPGGTGDSAGAPPAAPNPVTLAANPLDRLVQMQDAVDRSNGGTNGNRNSPKRGDVAPRRDPGQADDQDNPANANGDPANRQDLPPNNGDPANGDPANGDPANGDPANGDPANADPANADGVQLPAPLAAMDDGVRAEFMQLAEDLNAGLVNLGDIKRGHRLSLHFAEERLQLQDQIATLKEQIKTGAASAPAANLPESVVRLQTPAEVQQRHEQLRRTLRFCRKNPNGGRFGEGENVAEFTADEISEMQDAAEDEMELLPARAKQLEGQAQFTASQAQARQTVLASFPHLKDVNHAETKQVNDVLKRFPWISRMFVAPQLEAMKYVRGHVAVQADLAKLKKNGQAASRNVNGVPARRPASNGTQAARSAPSAKPSVKSATERINGGDRSVAALAELMDATNMG